MHKFPLGHRIVLARLSRSRWITLPVVGAVVIFWGVVLRDQLQALNDYPWQMTPGALVGGVIWSGLYQLTLALCWTLLLRYMGGTVPLTRGVHIWLLSMFTRYIPGNVWHIVTRVALAERLGVTRPYVLASATLEQGLTLLGALTLCALTLPFWGIVHTGQVYLIALVPLGLLALHPALLGRLLHWAAQRLRRPQLAWQYRFVDILALLGGYMFAMLWSGVALYNIVGGLTPVSLSQLPLFVGVATLAWAVGYLSFLTPGGLGVREGIVIVLLAQVNPLPVAIAGSLLYRLTYTIGEVGVMLLAWGAEKLHIATFTHGT